MYVYNYNHLSIAHHSVLNIPAIICNIYPPNTRITNFNFRFLHSNFHNRYVYINFVDKRNNMDSEKRALGQDFIEYQWIPQLVDDINAGAVDWGILNSVDTWKPFLADSYPEIEFEWHEFRHEMFRVDENSVIIAYVFPEPEKLHHAAFGAVFVRVNKNACAYYTLEKSRDEIWNVGSMQGGSHKGFGPLPQPSIESFLKWVVDRHNVI